MTRKTLFFVLFKTLFLFLRRNPGKILILAQLLRKYLFKSKLRR